jgi:hypothetical protein
MISGKTISWVIVLYSIKLTLFIINILLFISCSNNNKQKYELIKTKEIKLNFPQGEMIGRIFDMLEHDEKFYLVDYKAHKIWITDLNGCLLKSIGKYGRGPGDLNGPVSIVLKADSLLVLEKENSRISIFNLCGDYISQFPVTSGSLTSMEIDRDGKMIIIGESLGLWNYQFYSLNGRPINNSPKSERTQILMPTSIPGGQISLSSDNNILFSNIRNYNIVMINWNGDTLKSFTANPQNYIAPNLNNRIRLMNQKYWSLIILPLQIDNLILIQRFNYFLNPKNKPNNDNDKFYYDLFSLDGKLIAEGLRCESSYFLYQKDNFLYSIDYAPIELGNENPNIVIYRLEKLLK